MVSHHILGKEPKTCGQLLTDTQYNCLRWASFKGREQRSWRRQKRSDWAEWGEDDSGSLPYQQQHKLPAQEQLCTGVPRTALYIPDSLISQVPVSAKDRWSMTARQSEKLPSQGNLVEWNDVVIPVSWRMRLNCTEVGRSVLYTR